MTTRGTTSVPRKRLPYTEQWRDHDGGLRVYFRRGKGPRIPLPKKIGSQEFEAAYKAALAGHTAAPRVAEAPQTIAALITSYKRSGAYIRLRQTTKVGYASRIAVLQEKHGHRSVAGLTRERIVVAILQPYADRPGAELAVLKMLRVLIRHAMLIGWLKSDPSHGIPRPKSNEIRAWTEEEIEIFENRWPVGTKQRLGFALMLYTGQRRSDVHRMTWADITGRTIRVAQQKTSAKLVIRLHQNLNTVLAAAPREHVTILNTEFGKPFTVDGFSQWMRAAIKASGLPLECQPHGLRKAAGRRLAEVGCSARQIMAVLGHKTLAEAERYTRDADQKALAESAIVQLEGQRRNINAQTAPADLGNVSENEGETDV